MNKRLILLITVPTIVLFIVASIIYYFINPPTSSESNTYDSDTSKQVVNIESGLEDISKPIISAAEAYATQYKSESATKRRDRLSKYFSNDSPVYEYEQTNISSDIKKSVAKVVGVKSNASEGGIPSIDVVAQITYYSINNIDSTVESKTYWVVYKKLANKQVLIYDIGEY